MTRRLIDSIPEPVATETPFPTEAVLHSAIAAHPEVLPSEDLGLGPLVALGQELDFGHGPLDLLAVDATGRLAVIEFKRGTENPDVRKVIAQLPGLRRRALAPDRCGSRRADQQWIRAAAWVAHRPCRRPARSPRRRLRP